MPAPSTRLSRSARAGLALQAARAAADLRESFGTPDDQPACPITSAAQLGLSVMFTDINMEGFYTRSPRPLILLSALRPLPRKIYTCAHELGHHVFGHGARLDQLQQRSDLAAWEDPDEFLADTFAGHLLMPMLGLYGAFARRNWTIEAATPAQIFSIACDFGVGYRTLITHLAYGVEILSRAKARSLLVETPKSIRTALLGPETKAPLLIASRRRARPVIDAETGMLIILPRDTVAETGILEPDRVFPKATVFRAKAPGVAQIRAADWRAEIRISRRNYVGLARYRHLEEI